ncbi:MAG: hypothetical protein IJD10_05430 [Clostridia bacterium]|nr:hypothetical protein [Clostridia bacterium]
MLHPHRGLIEEFAAFGVPKEKILPTGIPVKREFYQRLPAAEAKARLGLPVHQKVTLLMGGSMGCGPLADTAKEILKVLPRDAVLVAVCGRNEKLYERLSALPETGSRLFPVGFTKEVAVYMDAAEVIVTKAGGLSSTEAAVKHLPIVFLDAIPGLEVHNRDYFVSRGFALFHDTPCGVAELVGRLMADDDEREAMRGRMAACFTHRSAEEMLERIGCDVAETEGLIPEELREL